MTWLSSFPCVKSKKIKIKALDVLRGFVYMKTSVDCMKPVRAWLNSSRLTQKPLKLNIK